MQFISILIWALTWGQLCSLKLLFNVQDHRTILNVIRYSIAIFDFQLDWFLYIIARPLFLLAIYCMNPSIAVCLRFHTVQCSLLSKKILEWGKFTFISRLVQGTNVQSIINVLAFVPATKTNLSQYQVVVHVYKLSFHFHKRFELITCMLRTLYAILVQISFLSR